MRVKRYFMSCEVKKGGFNVWRSMTHDNIKGVLSRYESIEVHDIIFEKIFDLIKKDYPDIEIHRGNIQILAFNRV